MSKSKKKSKSPSKQDNDMLIRFGVVGLIVFILALFFFVLKNHENVGGGTDSGPFPFVVFLPVWMLPIILADKKKQEEIESKWKYPIIALVGLTVLVLLGVVYWGYLM